MMSRYILEDEVLQRLKEAVLFESIFPNDAINAVLDCTTQDVTPVKHGHWVYGEVGAHCDQCGYDVPPELVSRYCPECGARMEDVKGEVTACCGGTNKFSRGGYDIKYSERRMEVCKDGECIMRTIDAGAKNDEDAWELFKMFGRSDGRK